MAKDKSSQSKKKDGNDKKSKVSDADGAPVESWDIVRKLDATDGVPCRLDPCPQHAAECWVSNLAPDDLWNMCAECVESEFGPNEEPTKTQDATIETITETTIEIADVTEATSEAAKQVSDNSSEDSGDDDKQSCEDEASTPQDTPSTPQDTSSGPEEIAQGPETLMQVDEASNDSGNDDKQSCEDTAPTPQDTPSTPPVDPSTPPDDPSTPPVDPSTPPVDPSISPPEKWNVVRKLDRKEKLACRIDGCRRRAVECWASSLDPDDLWDMCAKCIQADFGPEEAGQDPNTPIEATNESVAKTPGASNGDPADTPVVADTNDNKQGGPAVIPPSTEKPTDNGNADSPDSNVELECEEGWDIKKVMSHADLVKEGTIKCGTEDCILAAAVVYCSTISNDKWYSCLDCQVVDYDGWPEKLKEIPIKSMTHEHKQIMAQKCSRLSSPVFPKFPPSSPSKAPGPGTTNTLTPPPNGTKQVTPTPGAKKGKPSAQAMAIHRKWQAAAEAMSGPEARIVVDKKAAKKLILDLLYDAFSPMNITQIHAALKAVVPSPVLKQCLDDMALDKDDGANIFADSDDDEPKASKKKATTNSTSDEFAGALAFKAGRNANTSLYYVDHTKQKNSGNGLEYDSRDQLYTEKGQAEAEQARLKSDLNQMEVDTKRLNSEPTNEEATSKLETDEAAMIDLCEKLEDARKLKCNEMHKKQTKRRIEGTTTQWRKRRRICMDFLISMEENTDGSISMKKCLSGDGQIDIESDEKVIKDTKTFAENKRGRKKFKSVGKKSLKTQESSSQIAADENFIGVLLDTQGTVSRVFLDEPQGN
jgi:hypothetical protein